MGRRYYCEYCDKSFVATPDAVKKHRNGLVHQKLIKEHYHQFKDINAVLLEESVKNPCNRFQKTGECSFGLTCRYSHYSRDQLDQMRWEAQQKQSSIAEDEYMMNAYPPSLEMWFYSRRRNNMRDSPALEELFRHSLPTNVINAGPYNFQQAHNPTFDIPPSLRVTNRNESESSQDVAWG